MDEAHRPLGPEGVSLRFLDGANGVCLATYEPSSLSPRVYNQIGDVMVLGDPPSARTARARQARPGSVAQVRPTDPPRRPGFACCRSGGALTGEVAAYVARWFRDERRYLG